MLLADFPICLIPSLMTQIYTVLLFYHLHTPLYSLIVCFYCYVCVILYSAIFAASVIKLSVQFSSVQIAVIVSSRRLLSAVTEFLLAEKLHSASAVPCGNAKQAFTTLAKVQYFRLHFFWLSTWRHTSSIAGCALRESHFHSGGVLSNASIFH